MKTPQHVLIQRKLARTLNKLSQSATIAAEKKQEAEYIRQLKDQGKPNDR
jgi:hypothetical protein